MQALAETGQPVWLMHLATRLQMSQEKLAAHLARISDTEFDQQGNIIGWGITLLPTRHQFRLKKFPLFTWCAFDTVLFPPLLHVEAHVQSRCAATGQPITFAATRSAGWRIFFRPRAFCRFSSPPSGVTACVAPSVSNRCFSNRRRLPRPGWRCTPTLCFTRREEAARLGQMVANMWPHECAASSSDSGQTHYRFWAREEE